MTNLAFIFVYFVISKAYILDPDELILKTQVMIWHEEVLPFQSECIGTLISKDFVLTSASCFLPFDDTQFVDFAKVTIGKFVNNFWGLQKLVENMGSISHYGFTNVKDSGNFRKIQQVFIHPKFKAVENQHPDLALLKLKKPFEYIWFHPINLKNLKVEPSLTYNKVENVLCFTFGIEHTKYRKANITEILGYDNCSDVMTDYLKVDYEILTYADSKLLCAKREKPGKFGIDRYWKGAPMICLNPNNAENGLLLSLKKDEFFSVHIYTNVYFALQWIQNTLNKRTEPCWIDQNEHKLSRFEKFICFCCAQGIVRAGNNNSNQIKLKSILFVISLSINQ